VPKGFGDQMAGRPSAFGIDYETAAEEIPQILSLEHLTCTGLHIYSGTQCLIADAVCRNYRQFLKIFREHCEAHDLTPRRLIFGSGLGVPYHPTDTALDLDAVAAGIGAELDAFSAEPRFTGTKLVLELGRHLVAPAGYFLTQVIRVKISRGTKIGICDGGMNNHLPASGHFGMVIHRNYTMHRVGGGEGAEKVNLVGPLCTSIDRLANGVELPPVGAGDLVAIHNSGAYGLTASPVHFISHAPPREVLIEGGQLRDVTRNLGDPEG
jgi:diaminopimelate decarboxylase